MSHQDDLGLHGVNQSINLGVARVETTIKRASAPRPNPMRAGIGSAIRQSHSVLQPHTVSALASNSRPVTDFRPEHPFAILGHPRSAIAANGCAGVVGIWCCLPR
jgi:hypothetical protein